MALDDHELYRTCAADFQALLRSADREDGLPLTAEDVCALLERQQGMTIQCCPASLGGHPYGLVLRGQGLCIILHERHTSAWHQEAIIMHECGHIYYGHQGTEDGTAAALRVLVPDAHDEQLSAIVQHTGGAEGHRPEDERQAETFATVGLAWLSQRAAWQRGRTPPPVAASPPDDPAVAAVVRRLMADFGERGSR